MADIKTDLEIVEAFGSVDDLIPSGSSKDPNLNDFTNNFDTKNEQNEEALAHIIKSPSSNALEADCEQSRVEFGPIEDEEEDSDVESYESDDDGEPPYEDVLGTGDLMKLTVVEGIENGVRPVNSQWVSIRCSSPVCDGDNIQCFTFPLGFGYALDAWEIVLQLMIPGEVTSLTCAPRFAYGDAAHDVDHPYPKPLMYNIQLEKVGSIIDFKNMSDAEVVKFLAYLNRRGRQFYSDGHVEKAVAINRRAISIIDKEFEFEVYFQEVKQQILMNLSLYYWRLNEPVEGMAAVLTGLTIQPENKRLLYKKAQFHVMRKDFQDAIPLLEDLIDEYGSDCPFVTTTLNVAKAGLKEQLEKEKLVYKRMFGGANKPGTPRKRGAKREFVWTPTRKYLLLTFVVGGISVLVHFVRVSLGYEY